MGLKLINLKLYVKEFKTRAKFLDSEHFF